MNLDHGKKLIFTKNIQKGYFKVDYVLEIDEIIKLWR